MTLRANLVAAAVAAAATAVLVLALQRLGFAMFVLLAAAALAVVILDRPRVAVGLAVVATVLVEVDPYAGVSLGARLYGKVPGTPILGIECLLLLALGSVVLDASRRGRLRTPRPLRLPIALVGLALVSGMIVGHAAGSAPHPIIDQVRTILPLVLLPLLVVNVVRTQADVRAAIRLVVILTIVKAVIGLLALASGTGARPIGVGGHLTYFEPTANFLAMALVLGLVAAAVRRVPVGWRLWAGGAITLLCLVLSFRRSFWIGTAATVPILALIATGRTGRRLLVPAATLVGVALYLMFSSGAISASVDSPVGQRLTSLSPSKLASNPEDRYRIDERRNVVAELREHPVAGLGMAQPWAARYPLSLEHEGGRFYVHFAVLWWWLKMGVLGLVAYVAVMTAGIALGVRIWRRATDEVIRVGGLAAAMAFAGLALTEATATFVGAEVRMTTIAGAFLGLLAATVMTLEREPPRPEAPPPQAAEPVLTAAGV